MSTTTTESITETARAFFDACETGKGWAVCGAYCQPSGDPRASIPVHTLLQPSGPADRLIRG